MNSVEYNQIKTLLEQVNAKVDALFEQEEQNREVREKLQAQVQQQEQLLEHLQSQLQQQIREQVSEPQPERPAVQIQTQIRDNDCDFAYDIPSIHEEVMEEMTEEVHDEVKHEVLYEAQQEVSKLVREEELEEIYQSPAAPIVTPTPHTRNRSLRTQAATTSTVGDLFATMAQAPTVADVLVQKREHKSLNDSISTNDRYLFVKVLFNRNEPLYVRTIEDLEPMDSMRTVETYLAQHFPDWEVTSPAVHRFLHQMEEHVR